MSLEDKIERL